eukprot:5917364-Pyramimonas_sp.AAC.1
MPQVPHPRLRLQVNIMSKPPKPMPSRCSRSHPPGLFDLEQETEPGRVLYEALGPLEQLMSGVLLGPNPLKGGVVYQGPGVHVGAHLGNFMDSSICQYRQQSSSMSTSRKYTLQSPKRFAPAPRGPNNSRL